MGATTLSPTPSAAPLIMRRLGDCDGLPGGDSPNNSANSSSVIIWYEGEETPQNLINIRKGGASTTFSRTGSLKETSPNVDKIYISLNASQASIHQGLNKVLRNKFR